mgnify:CR=1 FL=1
MSILERVGNDPNIVFTVSESAWPETPRSATRLRKIYMTAEQAFRGAEIRSRANDGKTYSVLAVERNPAIDRMCAIQ